MHTPSLPSGRATRAAALTVVLLATTASARPPDDIVRDPKPVPGLVCYWTCMAFCIVAGKRQDQCDAACTDSCFTVVAVWPTCEADPKPVFG